MLVCAVFRAPVLSLTAGAILLTAGTGQALTKTERTRALIGAVKAKSGFNLSTQTIRGKVLWGSLETVIETQDGAMYAFATKGSVARRIFAVCNADDLCEVEGTLEGGDTIESVKKVRKLEAAVGAGSN